MASSGPAPNRRTPLGSSWFACTAKPVPQTPSACSKRPSARRALPAAPALRAPQRAAAMPATTGTALGRRSTAPVRAPRPAPPRTPPLPPPHPALHPHSPSPPCTTPFPRGARSPLTLGAPFCAVFPECAPNTYSAAGVSVCASCPAGSSSGLAATTCACTPGYSSAGTASSLVCTRTAPEHAQHHARGSAHALTARHCAAGAHRLGTPLSHSMHAGHGQHRRPDLLAYVVVRRGGAGAALRITDARKCAFGGRRHAACGANTYSGSTAGSCTACPANSTSTASASTCTCSAGTSQAGSGSTLACTGTAACPLSRSSGLHTRSHCNRAGCVCVRRSVRSKHVQPDGGFGHLSQLPGKQRQHGRRPDLRVQRRLLNCRHGLVAFLRRCVRPLGRSVLHGRCVCVCVCILTRPRHTRTVDQRALLAPSAATASRAAVRAFAPCSADVDCELGSGWSRRQLRAGLVLTRPLRRATRSRRLPVEHVQRQRAGDVHRMPDQQPEPERVDDLHLHCRVLWRRLRRLGHLHLYERTALRRKRSSPWIPNEPQRALTHARGRVSQFVKPAKSADPVRQAARIAPPAARAARAPQCASAALVSRSQAPRVQVRVFFSTGWQ